MSTAPLSAARVVRRSELARMRGDARLMQRRYCAMEGAELLELCAAARKKLLARNKAVMRNKAAQRRRKHGAGGGGGGGGRGGKGGQGGKGRRRGGSGKGGGGRGRQGAREGAREGVAPERPTHLAPEQLVRVRSWWCAEPTRGLEPRCVKGVVWADGQRGLHAIWSLFCTQAQHA